MAMQTDDGLFARYPLEPLERALKVADLGELANRLGISHRHARRLRATGLSDEQADWLACRAGMHPAAIWPEWWLFAPGPSEGMS